MCLMCTIPQFPFPGIPLLLLLLAPKGALYFTPPVHSDTTVFGDVWSKSDLGVCDKFDVYICTIPPFPFPGILDKALISVSE